jgi:hypothetical protein
VAVITALAIAVAVIAYLLLSGGDDGGGDLQTPRIVTPDELADLAGEVGHEVYWVGEQPGTRLEFSEAEDGRVYVRYLTGAAEAGDPNKGFLTVGTYEIGDAVAGLKVVAARPDSISSRLEGGGIAVSNEKTATSTYVAYPGSDYQVEVYDPDRGEALGLAITGKVVEVG